MKNLHDCPKHPGNASLNCPKCKEEAKKGTTPCEQKRKNLKGALQGVAQGLEGKYEEGMAQAAAKTQGMTSVMDSKTVGSPAGVKSGSAAEQVVPGLKQLRERHGKLQQLLEQLDKLGCDELDGWAKANGLEAGGGPSDEADAKAKYNTYLAAGLTHEQAVGAVYNEHLAKVNSAKSLDDAIDQMQSSAKVLAGLDPAAGDQMKAQFENAKKAKETLRGIGLDTSRPVAETLAQIQARLGTDDGPRHSGLGSDRWSQRTQLGEIESWYHNEAAPAAHAQAGLSPPREPQTEAAGVLSKLEQSVPPPVPLDLRQYMMNLATETRAASPAPSGSSLGGLLDDDPQDFAPARNGQDALPDVETQGELLRTQMNDLVSMGEQRRQREAEYRSLEREVRGVRDDLTLRTWGTQAVVDGATSPQFGTRYGDGRKADEHAIYYTNGVRTTHAEAAGVSDRLAGQINFPTRLVYNDTEGWGAGDGARFFADRVLWDGVSVEPAAASLAEAILRDAQSSKRVGVVAHSQGAQNTQKAVQLLDLTLTRAVREGRITESRRSSILRNVHVVTIGGAAESGEWPRGLGGFTHLYNPRDPIPSVFGEAPLGNAVWPSLEPHAAHAHIEQIRPEMLGLPK